MVLAAPFVADLSTLTLPSQQAMWLPLVRAPAWPCPPPPNWLLKKAWTYPAYKVPAATAVC